MPNPWRLPELVLGGVFALALAAFYLGGGPARGKAAYRIVAAAWIAVGVGLLSPLALLAWTQPVALSTTSAVVALTPPLVFLCAFYAVALCHKEQILRAAPEREFPGLGQGAGRAALVKVRGHAAGLRGCELFVSKVGRIPAIYLREQTQRYEADAGGGYGESRRRRGRKKGRYSWKVIDDGTSAGDFELRDGVGDTLLVEARRAEFHPLRTARFYNEVPVEQWFTRPYPGDTRTEITFIGPTAPLVVWGRARSSVREEDGASAEPRIVADDQQNLLVIVEGDASRIWSSRPLFGLLLTFVAIALTLLLVYCAATPGALDR